jgi:hypothetical protein
VPLLAASGAWAAPKTIGQGVRLKGTNVWYAHGTAANPRTLLAVVMPTPGQSVKVQWAVACQRPNPTDPADHLGTGEKGGQVTVHGAASIRLSMPSAKPPTCVVTVYATLAKAGRLSVRIVQAR